MRGKSFLNKAEEHLNAARISLDGISKRAIILALTLSAAFASNAQAGQLTLTWSDNSDNEDGFTIERSPDGSNYAQIGAVAANISTYIDSNVVDDQGYTYRVKAYNAYGDSGYSNTATGLYESPNTPPTITSLADQSILEDGSVSGLAFTIGDSESNSSDLSVIASSSYTSLLPTSGITLTGTGSNRSINLSPSSSAYGTTTVTLTVSDGTETAYTSFTLFVQSVTAPTISAINDQSIARGTNPQQVDFVIGDAETAASELSLSIASSNSNLIPSSSISLSGTDANRSATITPMPNAIGKSTIGITVSDGTGTATQSFDIIVYSAPIIIFQPSNTDTMVGETTTLSTGIESYPPATYQWYFNEVPIAGATAPQLSIAETQFSHEGLYKIVAANSYGTASSNEIVLNIDQIILAPTGLQATASQ